MYISKIYYPVILSNHNLLDEKTANIFKVLHYMATKINTLKFISFVREQYNKVKLATVVEGNPKAPFSTASTLRCRRGCYSFLWLLYFTLDIYLIMLSVKQQGIKYHFLSLWYDSTWNWTLVSQAIGKNSTH